MQLGGRTDGGQNPETLSPEEVYDDSDQLRHQRPFHS